VQQSAAALAGGAHAGSASLVRHAAVTALRDLAQLGAALVDTLAASDAQLFSKHLHPVFLAADAPEHQAALQALGVQDPQRVSTALRHLMRMSNHEANAVSILSISALPDAAHANLHTVRLD
jgi:hypothetical protein